MKYQNPVLRGFHPDPSICKVGDTYYLVTSTFEFLPGLPVYQSNDLLNWRLVSHVIDKSTAKYYPYSNLKNSLGAFAPTIRFHDGIFYIVCAFVPRGTFIVKTRNPTQGWSQPIWLKGGTGIDPSLTFLNDKCYLQMTEAGKIMQFLLDPDTGKILSEEKIISYGTGGRDPEGPHIYYQYGKFWLLLAEGGTRSGHMVTMQVADNINGPYHSVKNNPILTNRNYKNELQCVGHADIVQIDQERFCLVALATRQPPHIHRTLLGRETILLPVNWDANKIEVNKNEKISKATVNVAAPLKTNLQSHSEEDFTADNLLSVVGLPHYQLVKDELTLKANTLPLKMSQVSQLAPSFIGFAQTEFNGEFSFCLKTEELRASLAGLTVYKDDTHYFAVLYNNEQNTIQIGKRDSDLKIEQKLKVKLKGKIIRFILKMRQENYCVILKDNETEIAKTSMLTRHFTNEVSDSPFTGVVIGLRAIGQTDVKFNSINLRYENRSSKKR